MTATNDNGRPSGALSSPEIIELRNATLEEAACLIVERSRDGTLDYRINGSTFATMIRSLISSPSPRHQMVAVKAALEFYRDGFQFHPKRGPTGIDRSQWKAKPELLADIGDRAIQALAALAKLEDQP